MIIDKSTSDSLLVNSIRLQGSNGKPLRKIKLFNTDTLVATKDNDSTDTCLDFGFFINIADEATILALLPESLHNKVVPGYETAHGGSASMNYEITEAEQLLLKIGAVHPILCECSNCNTKFITFIDRTSELWGSARTNPTDKHLTVTKLDKSNIICDNCSTALHFEE